MEAASVTRSLGVTIWAPPLENIGLTHGHCGRGDHRAYLSPTRETVNQELVARGNPTPH